MIELDAGEFQEACDTPSRGCVVSLAELLERRDEERLAAAQARHAAKRAQKAAEAQARKARAEARKLVLTPARGKAAALKATPRPPEGLLGKASRLNASAAPFVPRQAAAPGLNPLASAFVPCVAGKAMASARTSPLTVMMAQ